MIKILFQSKKKNMQKENKISKDMVTSKGKGNLIGSGRTGSH